MGVGVGVWLKHVMYVNYTHKPSSAVREQAEDCELKWLGITEGGIPSSFSSFFFFHFFFFLLRKTLPGLFPFLFLRGVFYFRSLEPAWHLFWDLIAAKFGKDSVNARNQVCS